MDEDTITTEEIAKLGGWDISQGVIEVDQHNNERTLAPDEIIQIKPGHGFGKKHKWKRGLMRSRIEQELALLRRYYPETEHKEHIGEDWFRLPRYPFPSGWMINGAEIPKAPVVFNGIESFSVPTLQWAFIILVPTVRLK